MREVRERGRRPAKIAEGVSVDGLRKISAFAQRVAIGANTRRELTPKPQSKAHILGSKIDEIGRETSQPRRVS